MAKLYFKYGTMGSSKTAQALLTNHNYEKLGMKVWLLKPEIDNRDGDGIIKSRIGLSANAVVIAHDTDILAEFLKRRENGEKTDVIIVDECQFFTAAQIDAFREIVDEYSVPVLCFGLRTDFTTHCFEGSLRLLEIADSLTEIKMVCTCGQKSCVNVRIDGNGNIVTSGSQIMIGGNESYVAMCHSCYAKKLKEQREREEQE